MNIQQQHHLIHHNSNELIITNSNRLIKVKRSKNDILNNIVQSYLERRNYTRNISTIINNDSSSNLIDNSTSATLTSEQMAVALCTDAATARSNSILYSSCNNEPKQIMQHYLKWLNWLCNIKDIQIQSELWLIAGPLLCHLHVETLKANVVNQQQTLLNQQQQQNQSINQQQLYTIFERLRYEYKEKYQQYKTQLINNYNYNNDDDDATADSDVINNSNNSNNISDCVLDALQHITTLNDIESHLHVMTFRSCKYQIKLTSQAFNLLLHYLSKNAHVILIQVLQTWFDINIITNTSQTPISINYFNIHQPQQQQIITNNGDASSLVADQPQEQLNNDLLLKNLNDSILKMNQIHPPLLAYHFYNQQNRCSISASSISENFEYLACATEDAEIYLYNRNTTPLINQKKINISDNRYEKIVLRGHQNTIYDLKFIDQSYLLSISQDTTMKLWNYNNDCNNTTDDLVQYMGHQSAIWCCDVSAFTMYIGTGSADKSIRLWSIDSVYPLRICAGHTLDVNCIRFHPNSLYLASGSADRSIRLWNITDGSIVRLFSTPRSIQCIDFSPDGKYLICASELFLQIWDLSQASKLLEFQLNIHHYGGGGHYFITKLLWCQFNNYLYVTLNNGFIYIYNMNHLIQNVGSHCLNDESQPKPLFTINTKCTQSIINIQNIGKHIVYIGITD